MNTLSDLVLLFFAIYHLLVGVPAVLSVSLLRRIARSLYGLHLPEDLDPRYEYNLKPLGFYAITLGLLCLLELILPRQAGRAWFLALLGLLLWMRAAGRYFYRALLERAFQIPWKRSRWNVAFNLALGGLLFALAWSAHG